jgi:hypothetical protein
MSLSLPEKISNFLTNRRGRMYCDPCIQERLGLRWRQQVQLVAATLAVTPGYAREFGSCCVCQTDRQVTFAAAELKPPQCAPTASAPDASATAKPVASPRGGRGPYLYIANGKAAS